MYAIRSYYDWYFDTKITGRLDDIFWRHSDIPIEHLDLVKGVVLVEKEQWQRSMIWDSVFSYYDPNDCLIKIRKDIFFDPSLFECAILIAIGQSLLGNYAAIKEMLPVEHNVV